LNDREFTNINVKGQILNDGKPIAGFVVGDFKPWLSRTPPEDWLNMDGQEVSRATYAKLFEVIGTVGGAGDGSTTFNIPNLNGRTPVGYKADDADLNAVGKTGGEKAHVLTAAEVAKHSHPITDPGHLHVAHNGNDNGTNGFPHSFGSTGSAVNSWNTDTATTGITVNNQSTGGAAHNNMQPFFVVNWVIKYQ
jgi:microcystin-dependent protein